MTHPDGPERSNGAPHPSLFGGAEAPGTTTAPAANGTPPLPPPHTPPAPQATDQTASASAPSELAAAGDSSPTTIAAPPQRPAPPARREAEVGQEPPRSTGDPGASLKQLRRLRWAVRSALTLGVAASVAANILHARANPISQVIAAWPPLALWLTVELISRIPVHRRWLGTIRLSATTVIAGIAAWISYHHMVGVVARYGETGAAPYLLPVSVDGLIVVASISLVELNSRIRIAEQLPPTESAPLRDSVPATAVATLMVTTQPRQDSAVPVAVPAPAVAGRPAKHRGERRNPQARGRVSHGAGPMEKATSGARQASSRNVQREPAGASGLPASADSPPGRPSPNETVPTDTADAVAYWYRRDPALHPAEIGRRIGKSERTVRRYWPPGKEPAGINGQHHRDGGSATN